MGLSIKHVALLRGINVGRANRVAMADLRKIVEDLGYSDVRTLLNSGNVVFTVPDVATDVKKEIDVSKCNSIARARIEEALFSRLDVSTRVIVFTMTELANVVAENPLAHVAQDASRFLVAFLEDPADMMKLKPLKQQDWDSEILALGTRAAYLWCPDGVLASRLAKAVGNMLGDAVTMRNWATVSKINALGSTENKT